MLPQLGVLNLLVTHARIDAATVEHVVRAIMLAATELGRIDPLFAGLAELIETFRPTARSGRNSAAWNCIRRGPRLPGAGFFALGVSFQEVVHSVRTGKLKLRNFSNSPEDRMNIHKNARLTPKGREDMVRAVVEAG